MGAASGMSGPLAPNESGFQFAADWLLAGRRHFPTMTLDSLAPGEHALVSSVGGQGPFRRRLLELGVLPGTRVERTGQAPLGEPLTYRVRGAVLCLRRSEAATISVSSPESGRLAAK